MMYFRGFGGFGRCFGDGFGLMGSYLHSGRGLLMMGGVLLVTALIVVAIIALARKTHHSQVSAHSDGSLDLLNERYAKGEIKEEEYVRMKKVLRTK